jgi:hypothetical protein
MAVEDKQNAPCKGKVYALAKPIAAPDGFPPFFESGHPLIGDKLERAGRGGSRAGNLGP